MRKVITSLLFSFLVFLQIQAVCAQSLLPKDESCQPSIEEVLSLIESVYKWSTFPKGVLIAGEIKSFDSIRLREDKVPTSLTELIASAGGVFKTSNDTVYLIRQSTEEKTKSKQEVKLQDIKQGLAPDILLSEGDVVFVARGCSEGKLLPPIIKKTKQPRKGGLTDAPVPITVKNHNRKIEIK